MLVEGRCQAFSVDQEKKYKDMLAQFKQNIETEDSERRLKSKALEEELKEQLIKIKNEQRDR